MLIPISSRSRSPTVRGHDPDRHRASRARRPREYRSSFLAVPGFVNTQGGNQQGNAYREAYWVNRERAFYDSHSPHLIGGSLQCVRNKHDPETAQGDDLHRGVLEETDQARTHVGHRAFLFRVNGSLCVKPDHGGMVAQSVGGWCPWPIKKAPAPGLGGGAFFT